MSPLNHGRLCIITQPAQQIVLKAECHFRQFTSETDLQRLDISGITHNATSDSDICNLMISDVELELDSHVRKDVLHGIVSVYINVCSFSFVKGIIQQYKTAEKQTKTRALRKGISCKGATSLPGSPFLPPPGARLAKGKSNKGRAETVNSHFILTILLIT